jgi:hypothetical protein
LAVVVLGVAAYSLGTSLVRNKVGAPVAASPSPSAISDKDLQVFNDLRAGVSISFPKSWKKLQDNSASEPTDQDASQIRLIAGPSNDKGYLKLRVVPLQGPIDLTKDSPQADLAAVQAKLDSLIEGPSVKILERKIVDLNGHIAWYYLYEFVEDSSGREGAHAHYFIFDGAKMNVIVLEALPKSTFKDLAPTFDKIAESFKTTRRPG